MSILEKILLQKEKEVARLKKDGILDTHEPINKIPSLKETFSASTTMNVIAEIKRASPSKGAIQMDVDPVKQAKQYEALGAGAISVLTDKTFFKGSIEDLRAVREAVDIPLLCKDFIIDRIQINQAKAAGANIILLIVAALTETKMKELYSYAKKLNLDVLCEVHNESEMETAVALEADIIGINNRNLKTFDVSLQVTENLAPMVNHSSTLLIGESGVKTRADVERLANAGVSGVLVGETLMRSNNLQQTFHSLQVTKGQVPHAR